MKKKSLLRGKGLNSLLLLVVLAILFLFFFTYGRDAIQRAVDKLQAEPTPNGQVNLNGLGPAVLLVIALIITLALLIPAVMLLVASLGNLLTRKGKSVRFTVTSLIAEFITIPILLVLASCMADATLNDKWTLIVYISAIAFTVLSLVWSVLTLILRKNATE